MIAFAADDPAEIDIYAVLGRMAERVWLLNGLQRRPAVQLCVTLRHSEAGMVDHLVRDLDLTVTESGAIPGQRDRGCPSTG